MNLTTQFTPLASLVGGGMIGLAALMLMGLTGRIAGISGIVGQLFDRASSDRGWRIAFIAGLIAAPAFVLATGQAITFDVHANPILLVGAGLLVGIGTQMGSGCTSGHGVCGISRLSARSLVATVSFMVAGAVTVFVFRHLI